MSTKTTEIQPPLVYASHKTRLESNLHNSSAQELPGQEIQINLFSARIENKRMRRNERALTAKWDTSNDPLYTKQKDQQKKGGEGVGKNI